MDALERICADLGINIIPCNQTIRDNDTKAGNILRRLLDRTDEGHVILVLRTITESEGNQRALIEPVINAISDIILGRPSWANRGLAWIEAFDGIDLLAFARMARASKKIAPARAAIATMICSRLWPIFDPPKVRPPKREYFYKRGPRKPKVEPLAEAA